MKLNKAVFLDRDGTIVVHEPYLSSPEQLKLLPNAANGIRIFQEYGYLVIVVTNQSGIARGFFDENRLALIHKKLAQLLDAEGVTLDDIYYCPHHTEGSIKQYKINCDCRKPKPNMLLYAAKKHHIDLSESLMIGDSEVDMLAGKLAGCTCILIKDGIQKDSPVDLEKSKDYMAKDLLEAAQLLPDLHTAL
ncbi:MAG: HAD family hydrolase [Candidatus Brocadiaceae bacterium]|nr:HAD family hydrolase [Candidatus Brocadiaceae bacterium]